MAIQINPVTIYITAELDDLEVVDGGDKIILTYKTQGRVGLGEAEPVEEFNVGDVVEIVEPPYYISHGSERVDLRWPSKPRVGDICVVRGGVDAGGDILVTEASNGDWTEHINTSCLKKVTS